MNGVNGNSLKWLAGIVAALLATVGTTTLGLSISAKVESAVAQTSLTLVVARLELIDARLREIEKGQATLLERSEKP